MSTTSTRTVVVMPDGAVALVARGTLSEVQALSLTLTVKES